MVAVLLTARSIASVPIGDPEQAVGRAPRQGYITFSLPAPGGTSWLTVFRDMAKNEVGLFLSSHRDTPASTLVGASARTGPPWARCWAARRPCPRRTAFP
jgi:hypothetical protein